MYDLFKSGVEKIKIEIWVFVLYILNIYIFNMKDSDVEMVYNYINQFEFLSKLLNYEFTFFIIKMIVFILIVYTISIVVASLFVSLNYPETKNNIKIKIKSILNKINLLNDKSSDNSNNESFDFEKNMKDMREGTERLIQLVERFENKECTPEDDEEVAKITEEFKKKGTIFKQRNKELKNEIKERETQNKQFDTISNRVSNFFSFEKTTSDLVILSYINLLLFSIAYRYGIFSGKIEGGSIVIILFAILAQFLLARFFSFLGN